MKCYICNSDMDNFNFNSDHGDIDPCGTCKAIIADVFAEEGDDERLVEVEPTAEELLAAAEEEYYGDV